MPTTASPGATYGWRARIGFVTPTAASENNPFEFYLMAPEGVTIVLTSLGLTSTGTREYMQAIERFESGVQELANRNVDALVQAGVPLIVDNGWGFEDELRARAAKVTSLPLATDIGGCIAAMQALQMSRPAVVTVFDDAMHEKIGAYVGKAGIEMAAVKSLRTEAFRDVSTVPLSVPYRAAKEVFKAAGDADGVWITGALMPSVGIIDALEQDLGVPVVTSMQAMCWSGLRMTGIKDEIRGYGRLFDAGR